MPFLTSEADTTPKPVAGWVSASLYALFVLTLSSLMLVCNSFFCYVLIGFIPLPPDRMAALIASQLFYFLVPVMLTFLQWYLFDQLNRAFN